MTDNMLGWSGKILRVDLGREKVVKQQLEKEMAVGFLGGRGFNSKVLFDEVKPGIDPFSPDNVICFAIGPFTGTTLPSSGRIEVSTLSPLSGILGDGNAGGYFPTYLKLAGYDQIVFSGRASKPVYLRIDNDQAELKDASDIWGRSTWETTDMLQEENGKDFRVSSIGQAGENLVRFASMIFDKHFSAARGSGAVAGSKNLKAIAVRGTKKVQLANPDEFEALADADRDFFFKDKIQREIAKYGTHLGMLKWWPGFRYFKKYLGVSDVPQNLRPESWKKYEIKRAACYGCPVGCKDVYRIPDGKYKDEIGTALEFEGIFCMGTNCGVLDPVSIMVMGNLTDKYGMCQIPLGDAIAFAKELFELGIITDKDTGGLSLEWEAVDDQIELIHQIALREGFGNIVAEGQYGIAKIFDKNAMNYCYHVKGLCRGPSDYPAGVNTLAHATSTRGADHLRGRSMAFGENDPEIFPDLVNRGLVSKDTVPALVVSENAATLADAIGRCKGAVNSWAITVPLVSKYPLWDGVLKVFKAGTGLDFTEKMLLDALERIYTIERAFLVRQGIARKHDRLVLRPHLMGTKEGNNKLAAHENQLTDYYNMRGWDPETGVPTRATLKHLGLNYVAEELKINSPYPDWDGPPFWPLNKYPHGGKRA